MHRDLNGEEAENSTDEVPDGVEEVKSAAAVVAAASEEEEVEEDGVAETMMIHYAVDLNGLC